MNVVALRAVAWVAVVAGVLLFAGLAPEPPEPQMGLTAHVPAEGEYLLALVPLEVASAALLLLIAIGPLRGGSFDGARRVLFWAATVFVMAFWIFFYMDWRQGLLDYHLAALLLS